MSVQIPAARIYNLPTARMYTLICYSDSPPGGGRTAPPGRCRGQPFGRTFETRTVTRTALREDLRNSDDHTDRPSGGTHELRPKLRSLYRVAHMRCHLSGRASASRTSSYRNPDSLSALRNYFAWRERRSQIIAWHLYESKGMSVESASPPLFIGKTQGVGAHEKH